MFLINIITPWSAHQNIGEYAGFLLQQHILPHFRKGSNEVHLQMQNVKYKVQSILNVNVETNYTLCHLCITTMLWLGHPTKIEGKRIKCQRSLVIFLSKFSLKVLDENSNKIRRTRWHPEKPSNVCDPNTCTLVWPAINMQCGRVRH